MPVEQIVEANPSILYSRSTLRDRWPEYVTLALYAAVLAFAIPYHEPWVDEAQAWQLARSLSLHDLFVKYIRYEGSPGLWHFLLWIMNRMHVSYTGLHWFCGALALAGVSVLVLKAPLPRYLKLSLPFSYFLLFQYAVIARNYVLFPLVLFTIAACWKKSSVLLACLLGLLANISLHAAVISGGLAIVYAVEQIRKERIGTKRRHHLEFLLAAVILLIFYAFAIWTAWPAHDLTVVRVRGQSRPIFLCAIASLVWGICEPWLISLAFWAAIFVGLREKHKTLYLLPVLLFGCFSGAVYATFWHVGMLLPLTACLFWITWPERPQRISRKQAFAHIALAVAIGTQILWSAYAITYDHFHAYSPDRATAEFLKPFVHKGNRVDVTYLTNVGETEAYCAIGLLPYFEHNIFINQEEPFWRWTKNNGTEDRFYVALRARPKIVLVVARQERFGKEIVFKGSKIDLLNKNGYVLTDTFCGARPERLELVERACDLIFQRSSSSSDSQSEHGR